MHVILNNIFYLTQREKMMWQSETRNFIRLIDHAPAAHPMYFLHRRVKLKFSGSRARHFRAPSVASRFLEAPRCFYGPHARAGVHSQHLLEYGMPSGIPYRFIYTPWSVSPSAMHVYWAISGCKWSVRWHIRCRCCVAFTRRWDFSLQLPNYRVAGR